jgi:hypothetical protein
MKKTFVITIEADGEEIKREIEVEAIKAISSEDEGDDDVIQDAILVHAVDDEFGNGDGIIFWDMPEDAESLENLLFNEYCETTYCIDDNGIYHAGAYNAE